MKKNKKEIMKKIGSIVVAGTILLGSNSIVLAKENNYVSANNIRQNKTNTQEEIEVYYNGEKIEFDQKPILVNDRTLVPFRKVFESMGCIVYYNNSESKVMALTKEGDILTHTIGTNTFELNGEEKTFDSASTILNDRTLIPLRAVAETLSAEVEWNDKEQTVTIEKEESTLDEIEKEVISHVLDVNYNPKDTKRYVEYRKQHPELSIEQVIMDVNMDLDREFVLYTDGENYTNDAGNGIYRGLQHYDSKVEDREEIDNPDDILALVNNFNTISNDYEPTDLIDVYPPADDFLLATGSYTPSHKYLREEAALHFLEMKNKYLEDNVNNLNDVNDSSFIYYYTAYTPINSYYNSKNIIASDLERYRQMGINGILGEYKLPQGNLEIFAFKYSSEREMSEYRTGLTFTLPHSSKNHLYNFIITNYDKNYPYDSKIYNPFQEPMLNWTKENAHKYGFILRYPEGKENITRRGAVDWTFRYVGEVAKQIYEENLCLEEYYAKYLNPVVNENKYSIEEEATQKVLKKY